MNREPAPARLVHKGAVSFGLFDAPVREMNIREAAQYRGAGRLRFKQWIGFAIEHAHWHVCVFMLDAGYLASATVYAHHRASGRSVRRACVFPPGGGRLADTLLQGRCDFASPGFHLAMECRADRGYHNLEAFAPELPGLPGMRLHLALEQDMARVAPLVASLPLTRGRTMYTHKAPMPARGRMRVGGDRFEFEPDRDIAIMDEHRSFLHGPVRWTWCTCAGFTPGGHVAGINLGDHETIADQRAHGENCVWSAAGCDMLGPAAFDFNPRHPARPWRMRTHDGRAALVFLPQGRMAENHGLGPVRMDYYQMSGRFYGTAVDGAGREIAVHGFPGVAERMNAVF